MPTAARSALRTLAARSRMAWPRCVIRSMRSGLPFVRSTRPSPLRSRNPISASSARARAGSWAARGSVRVAPRAIARRHRTIERRRRRRGARCRRTACDRRRATPRAGSGRRARDGRRCGGRRRAGAEVEPERVGVERDAEIGDLRATCLRELRTAARSSGRTSAFIRSSSRDSIARSSACWSGITRSVSRSRRGSGSAPPADARQ